MWLKSSGMARRVKGWCEVPSAPLTFIRVFRRSGWGRVSFTLGHEQRRFKVWTKGLGAEWGAGDEFSRFDGRPSGVAKTRSSWARPRRRASRRAAPQAPRGVNLFTLFAGPRPQNN